MRILHRLVVSGLLVIAALVSVTAAEAAVGEGTATPATTESWGCGQPSTDGSYAGQIGQLPNSQRIGGVRADLLGRSIGEIRGDLEYWTVPMSGGYRVLMHERVIPALNQVTVNLAAEQAKGNYYAIKPSQTYGFSARTIGGRYQVSLHGHGIALDMNTLSNPYRGDNVLITNMPDWFVKAWTDAGFCWGGDWNSIKDPQHFSWMGPTATPGYGAVPDVYPVDTSPADFSDEVLSTQTPFGEIDSAYTYILGDGDSDGLADVFQFVPRANGTRLEYSQTDRKHQWCAIGRDHALDIDQGERIALLGDYSRVGRNDLWLLDTSGAELLIEISLKPTSFEESIVIPTTIPVETGDVYLLADHDRDSYVDLLVLRRTTDATTIEVYSGADDFATKLLDVDTGLGDTDTSQFTIGDTDLDESPDLFVVDPHTDGTELRVLPNGYQSVASTQILDIEGTFIDVLVNDYDGDGRGDLWFWDDTGTVTVRLGNSRLPGVTPHFWHNSPDWECDEDAIPYGHDGVFRDDDGNIHEADIEAIAAAGITLGCNPPFNDDYCPDADVTRGQMAAFLVREFGLTDDGGQDWFVDDTDQVFEGDINRLAAAGITKGCNPPTNDEYCPGNNVTRGQMAAFLVRGLGLDELSPTDFFVDDSSSEFESEINRLAAVGVTKGCNPPQNDRFCPSDNVGRDEMASFLARALQLLTSQ